MMIRIVDGTMVDVPVETIEGCRSFVRSRPVLCKRTDDGYVFDAFDTANWCLTHVLTGKAVYFQFHDPKTCDQFAVALENIGAWENPDDLLLELGTELGFEYVATGDAVRMA